jgi:hypothetical protein
MRIQQMDKYISLETDVNSGGQIDGETKIRK